jgi:hypothetical protein
MVQYRSIDTENVEEIFASFDFRILVVQSDREPIP